MGKQQASKSLFEAALLQAAAVESFRKLTPQQQWKNPVMFVVYIGSLLTTVLWLQALAGQGQKNHRPQFCCAIAKSKVVNASKRGSPFRLTDSLARLRQAGKSEREW